MNETVCSELVYLQNFPGHKPLSRSPSLIAEQGWVKETQNDQRLEGFVGARRTSSTTNALHPILELSWRLHDNQVISHEFRRRYCISMGANVVLGISSGDRNQQCPFNRWPAIHLSTIRTMKNTTLLVVVEMRAETQISRRSEFLEWPKSESDEGTIKRSTLHTGINSTKRFRVGQKIVTFSNGLMPGKKL